MATASAPSQNPLRGAREARGMGLRELARRAKIDPSHLSRVERGDSQLSLAALKRVADVLELRELQRFLEPYLCQASPGEKAS